MGYWGWRRLFAVFISVWVVGCSITHDTAPTVPPTYRPEVTLIARIQSSITPSTFLNPVFTSTLAPTATPLLYRVQEGETLSQIARQFGVPLAELQAVNGRLEPRALQIGETLYIPNPHFNSKGYPIFPTSTPLNVLLEPPFCYATSTNQIICLGSVVNQLSNPLEHIVVSVRLLRQDGSALAENQVALEQRNILPGERAPYRLSFTASTEDYSSALALLLRAESGESDLISVMIEAQQRTHIDDHYRITGTLYNAESKPLQLFRAVAILHNHDGQITGYRVVQLDQLMAAGARAPFQIAIIPQLPGEIAAHTLYVEARQLVS